MFKARKEKKAKRAEYRARVRATKNALKDGGELKRTCLRDGRIWYVNADQYQAEVNAKAHRATRGLAVTAAALEGGAYKSKKDKLVREARLANIEARGAYKPWETCPDCGSSSFDEEVVAP